MRALGYPIRPFKLVLTLQGMERKRLFQLPQIGSRLCQDILRQGKRALHRLSKQRIELSQNLSSGKGLGCFQRALLYATMVQGCCLTDLFY